ncbi:hypothetical protein DW783_23660, partial [Phocaeicola vulgatus]
MKIKSISFGDIPFRMFRNLTINISERLTVIAGHNGIGKSTLLGLIANGSELKSSEGKTLLKRSFQAQLHELFYLDIARDYVKKSADKPYFTLTYSERGKEDLTKICNVSKHSDKKQGIERLKVVPRGEQEGWNVGPSAKVPIPTMFLSMSRMLPNGEYQSSLNSELSKALSEEDKLYIREKFKAIIDNKVVDSDHITKQELKGTTKRSLLPEFEHSTRTISLGQDSLGVIITALASFAKLKRENPNYNGGILLIDEIDAGFHPRAQIKLIQLIKKEAKSLNLQIIMTSHSLTIIQEVLKINDETARSGRNIDSVVYIEDVLRPKLMEYPTYENIKGDMLGILPAFDNVTPQIKIYFEDKEAEWFFKKMLEIEKFDSKLSYGYDLIFVSAKLGCDNLKTLYTIDDYFRQVVIVFDNDVLLNDRIIPIMKESKTILALPAIIDNEVNNAELRTPEFQVFNYLSKLLQNLEHPYWNNLPHRYNIEFLSSTYKCNFLGADN